MSRSIRTSAIVLRRTNYGEADRIIQLLTADHGKISVMARGVRREKSRLAGGIELFARCDVTLHQGKGNLAVLTGSRIEQLYHGILGEYDRLQFAYEVMKALDRAAETLDEPAFFALLDTALAELSKSDVPLKVIQAWFWLQLAILLGEGVNLSTDDHGMKLVEGARYDFDELQAVFSFREAGRFDVDRIKFLRILSAQPPHVAMQVQGVDELIDDCLWLATRAVAH